MLFWGQLEHIDFHLLFASYCSVRVLILAFLGAILTFQIIMGVIATTISRLKGLKGMSIVLPRRLADLCTVTEPVR